MKGKEKLKRTKFNTSRQQKSKRIKLVHVQEICVVFLFSSTAAVACTDFLSFSFYLNLDLQQNPFDLTAPVRVRYSHFCFRPEKFAEFFSTGKIISYTVSLYIHFATVNCEHTVI